MATYVAFLRAINLGARRKFPKSDVQRVVEETGARDVAVHLNTGNVLLTSRQRSPEAVATTLERAFAADRGFEVPTVVLTLPELTAVAADAARLQEETSLDVAAHYVSFLRDEPGAEGRARFAAMEAPGEEAHVLVRAVHCLVVDPEAYRMAKLPIAVERHLGVATSRNLTVVRELVHRWG